MMDYDKICSSMSYLSKSLIFHVWILQYILTLNGITRYELSSLVDGGGLQIFLCDPMHTLRSSGYTLSGI